MKKLLLILILLNIIACKKNIVSKKNTTIEIDTLFFKHRGFNDGINLYLFSNNKFKYQNFSHGCLGGGENEIVTGKYTMNDNKLLLKPDSVKISILPFNSHTNPKKYNLKYRNDSLKIKTEYDIIKWNNISYLISPQKDKNFRNYFSIFETDLDVDSVIIKRNDYYKFADYYNEGYEPENHGRYLTLKSKKTDTLSNEMNIGIIPKEWRNLFLKEPITITAMKIKKIKKTYDFDNEEYFIYRVMLNKGKVDGIRIGLTFYDKTLEKRLKIVKINKTSSIGMSIDNILKGETLKTKWK